MALHCISGDTCADVAALSCLDWVQLCKLQQVPASFHLCHSMPGRAPLAPQQNYDTVTTNIAQARTTVMPGESLSFKLAQDREYTDGTAPPFLFALRGWTQLEVEPTVTG